MEASLTPCIVYDSEVSKRCIAQGRHARNFERLGGRDEEDEEEEDEDTIKYLQTLAGE